MAVVEAELDWIRCFGDGLDEVKAERLINDEFSTEIQPFLSSFKSLSQNLKVLKRQERLIEDDLTEELQVKRYRTTEPGDGHLEQTYASTIVARAMAASSNQKKARHFNQNRFRKDMVQYYNATDPEDGSSVWCHVLETYLPPAEIKAAHLVPKRLSNDEVSFLFGAREGVLSDCRNGKSSRPHLLQIQCMDNLRLP